MNIKFAKKCLLLCSSFLFLGSFCAHAKEQEDQVKTSEKQKETNAEKKKESLGNKLAELKDIISGKWKKELQSLKEEKKKLEGQLSDMSANNTLSAEEYKKMFEELAKLKEQILAQPDHKSELYAMGKIDNLLSELNSKSFETDFVSKSLKRHQFSQLRSLAEQDNYRTEVAQYRAQVYQLKTKLLQMIEQKKTQDSESELLKTVLQIRDKNELQTLAFFDGALSKNSSIQQNLLAKQQKLLRAEIRYKQQIDEYEEIIGSLRKQMDEYFKMLNEKQKNKWRFGKLNFSSISQRQNAIQQQQALAQLPVMQQVLSSSQHVNEVVKLIINIVLKLTNNDPQKSKLFMDLFFMRLRGLDKKWSAQMDALATVLHNKINHRSLVEAIGRILRTYEQKQLFVSEVLRYLYGPQGDMAISWQAGG